MQGIQEKKGNFYYYGPWRKPLERSWRWGLRVVGSRKKKSHSFGNWVLSFSFRYNIWFEIVNVNPLYKYYHFLCWTISCTNILINQCSLLQHVFLPCFINVVTSIFFPQKVFLGKLFVVWKGYGLVCICFIGVEVQFIFCFCML